MNLNGTDRDLLVRQLLDLGVEPGTVLVVHSAFWKVGPVEGGPVGLVAALREALGIGHDANTTIRLAESLAGVRYRREKYITILEDGGPVRFQYREIGHCCQNFALVDRYFEETERHWKMMGVEFTNFHRSLSTYIHSFLNAGFQLSDIIEPTVTTEQVKVYPQLADELRVPNFIVYVLSKPRT